VTTEIAPKIAVSSWSLHRAIGLAWWDAPKGPGAEEEMWGPGTLPILDFPAAAAARGIDQIHLCHFHVADRGPAWIGAFRRAMDDAGVTLSMLLIDDGDITDPEHGARDTEWVAGWIDTAAALGARSARVIAGKQKPTEQTLALSADALARLVRHGDEAGIRVATENWLDLLSGPDEVDIILDAVAGLDFLADFGNWKGPTKYADLVRILRRASDTHTKAFFPEPGVMDADDFGRCLAACTEAGYDGPYTLIYESPSPDEWSAVAAEQAFVRDYFAGTAARRTA
jgi:sugar phosphate isomerase/epimerase